MARWLFALLLLPVLAGAGHPLATALESAQAQPVPAVTLTYDDAHPLYGGALFDLRAGLLTRTDVPRAQQERVVTRVVLTPEDQRRLLEVLRSIDAWEQREPERTPVPDESRTRLTVRVGEAEASIWEWSNDLEQNGRLILVRRALDALVPAGAP
jgi:hypothetical protein